MRQTTRKTGNYFILFIYCIRERATDVHHSVVEAFFNGAKEVGLDYSFKKEVDLLDSDLGDHDLVISIGRARLYSL